MHSDAPVQGVGIWQGAGEVGKGWEGKGGCTMTSLGVGEVYGMHRRGLER
jgi:hypothetical protein